MNVVLLESLAVSHELLNTLFAPLKAQGHTLTCYERTTDEDTLIREAQDADVLMIANMPLSGRVIRACKHLQFIDVAFTGVDHVDLDAAREVGVAVSNAAGYSEQSVAELVVGQMIHLLRNVPAVENRCRNGGTKDGLVGNELGSSVVGIVGVGAIGSRVATLCRAFGSTVIGYVPHPSEHNRALLTYVSLEELLQRAGNTMGGYEKKLEARREKTQAARAAQQQAQDERMQAEQRLRALEDLEKNREGFSGAVKLVLQEAGHGRLPGVHGALSSLIETKRETALAIETALGAAMQHIVVDNEQQAKRAILLLKSKNAGRATFLPLSAVQPRSGEGLPREGEGIVGAAAGLVSCEEAYRPLVASLLGRTLVTRDIDSAIAVARRHGYRFRIVTLDGQMVNAGGSLTGGSQVRGAGILTRRNEIEALTQQVRQMKEKEQQAAGQMQQCVGEERRVEAEMQGALSELQAARERHIKGEAECAGAKEALELLLRSREDMCGRLDQAKRAKEQALALLEKAQEQQRKLLQDQSALEAELAALEAEHAQQAQRVEAEMAEISDCRLSLTAAQRDEEALQETLRQTKELLDLQDTDCGQLKEELLTLSRQEEELSAGIQGALEGEAASRQQAQQLLESLRGLTGQREQQESRRSALRLEEKELLQQRENLIREQERCEAQRTQVQSEHDGIVASLWDEYELTVSQAKELRTPMESAAAARRRIAQLKQDMKALGHVNVDAIEEYKEVKQQFDFYTAQIEDLEVSKQELEGMISELTKEMQSIFSQQFEVINRHFGQTFADLFGGGKAMLSLDDPSDVLQSGIELRVQPPGKVINNLSALSGGEQALTAIALYFAILQVRPSPFVILDEIDTALDEVNVVRLANYYKRFTQKTQLILITHRRGAMEAADVLYGITMQERGVSKLLKIDVNDVERQINLRAK